MIRMMLPLLYAAAVCGVLFGLVIGANRGTSEAEVEIAGVVIPESRTSAMTYCMSGGPAEWDAFDAFGGLPPVAIYENDLHHFNPLFPTQTWESSGLRFVVPPGLRVHPCPALVEPAYEPPPLPLPPPVFEPITPVTF